MHRILGTAVLIGVTVLACTGVNPGPYRPLGSDPG